MASRSSFSSMLLFGKRNEDHLNQSVNIHDQDIHLEPPHESQNILLKKRRNRRGVPYPDAEVISLSPTTLLAKNKFVCEVCLKGFPREQNLQLHKRGHNLPWQLKQKTKNEEVMKRKVYLCPEPSCINHDPSHALGDLTGIKKHYSRKHGEKTFKCRKCSKMYAVQSDLKAHLKTCGTKEYECHCGTLFSRRDSFITHRAFCDALAEGNISAIGVRSFKSTEKSNDQPSQMCINLPHFGSQVPCIKNLTRTTSENASSLPQFGQKNYNRTAMDLKPSPSFNIPSSDQQNQQKYQGSFAASFTNLVNNTTTPHNNLEFYNLSSNGNRQNSGSGEGSSLFSGSSIVSDQSPSLYLSATGMLQKAGLLGSTSSNNSVTNFAQGYATTSNSPSNKSENGRFLFGSVQFGNSGGNGHESHDSNMNELLNTFSSSGVGSCIFNRYAGETYEQAESHLSGIDSGSGDYADEWKNFNSEEQQQTQNTSTFLGFQKYSGVQMTRDFLGVGGRSFL